MHNQYEWWRRRGLAFLTVGLLVGAACATPAPAPQRSPAHTAPDPGQQLTAVADDYYAHYLLTYPERLDVVDVADKHYDRLSDNSLAVLKRWQLREDAWLERLRTIDAKLLTGKRRALHAMLLDDLESAVALRVCRRELWTANHMSGWQVSYPFLIAQQPLGTAAARGDALTRWGQLPRFINSEIDNLRVGLELGYTVPKSVVELIIAQVDSELAALAQQSAYMSPATRDDDAEFRSRWRTLVIDEIYPALRAYRDFLANEYAAHTRVDIALTAIPNGRECYRAYLRAYTTLDISGDEVFALGTELVKNNGVEIVAMGRALFRLEDLPTIVAQVRSDPDLTIPAGDEVVTFADEVNARARRSLPDWFADIPDRPSSVQPWPAALDGVGASDQYQAAGDASGPGIYRISIVADRNRADLEVTTLHELNPGHHLQISIEQSLGDRHPVVKLLGNVAYVEGWARYAEALAEEMGLYTLHGSKILRRSWPGRGMVVDPGIHLRGWSRERAIAVMAESGRFSAAANAALVDRMAVMPGQLTAYDTGASEIFALRRQAEAALGDRFDIREFHTRILENGPVPLAFLRQHVRDWLAAQP